MSALTVEKRARKTSESRPVVRITEGLLSVVMPAHNEEDNIGVVVAQALEILPTIVDDFEIVIVNDGSKDGTGRLIDDLAERHPEVRALHHPKNRGYGAALTTGFQNAQGRYVMFMDSDRQFDVADLALLSPFVGKFDIVAGFRMERNDPFHRRIFAETFNLTVRTLFGVHVRDIDCAFKVFDGDMLRSIELTAPGALLNAEILAKARRQGASLEQVGVHHYARVAGKQTGGSFKVVRRAMKETVLLWWRMHNYSPPADRPNVKGPYRLGDLAVASGAVVGLLVFTRILGKIIGR